MKKIIKALLFIITVNVFAQAPEKMSYQAVVRDADNILIAEQTIGMQISILRESSSGPIVYQEIQTPITNLNGLISIEIGAGIVASGVFNTIDWGDGIYFVKTEIDPEGGTNYTLTSISQLLSVPYALHSKVADNISEIIGFKSEDSLGVFNKLNDPSIAPFVEKVNTPGIVDNRFYRYKYLFKKGNRRTRLSPLSQTIQIEDNTVQGQIGFSVMITNETDVDSIVVYRQFSVDNLTYGPFNYVNSFSVTSGQLFSFMDNNDNFTVTNNPEPLEDINTTKLYGVFKTDLLTENREYQLPDSDGTIALLESLRIFNPLSGVNSLITNTNITVAEVRINETNLSELRTITYTFDRPVLLQALGHVLDFNNVCDDCPLGGTVTDNCGIGAQATGNMIGYRIIVEGEEVFSSTAFGFDSISALNNIDNFFEQGCLVEVDYNYERTGLPNVSPSCQSFFLVDFGVYGETPEENVIFIED